MWCAKCQKQLFECTCPDIEERLARLQGTAVGPAVEMNLAVRRLHQAANDKGGTRVQSPNK